VARAAISVFANACSRPCEVDGHLAGDPSLGLMESMSKRQMTTFKEKLQALHDALSDTYDEDQENDDPTC
jgi:hypothetical protein